MPEGQPTQLAKSRTVTGWADDSGGALALNPDGTFTADHLCGDYHISAYGPENDPKSGAGTWDESDQDGQTSVTIAFERGPESTYEALRDGKTLKLWSYVGDPDSGHSLCILTGVES
ncbi:hypothetical protein [Streptomyces sp. NPDC000410]|uniref:hypothetical protein n=1 Tax=Streptomyces sp. NPDC000410 TaxID=3154254 RepID=UPI003318682F